MPGYPSLLFLVFSNPKFKSEFYNFATVIHKFMNFFANFSKGCNSIQIVLYDIRRPNHSQAEGPPGYYQVRPWLRTSTWWFFGKFLVRDFQKIRKWAGSSSTAGQCQDQGVVKHMHTIILRILMQSKVPECAPLM